MVWWNNVDVGVDFGNTLLELELELCSCSNWVAILKNSLHGANVEEQLWTFTCHPFFLMIFKNQNIMIYIIRSDICNTMCMIDVWYLLIL